MPLWSWDMAMVIDSGMMHGENSVSTINVQITISISLTVSQEEEKKSPPQASLINTDDHWDSHYFMQVSNDVHADNNNKVHEERNVYIITSVTLRRCCVR